MYDTMNRIEQVRAWSGALSRNVQYGFVLLLVGSIHIFTFLGLQHRASPYSVAILLVVYLFQTEGPFILATVLSWIGIMALQDAEEPLIQDFTFILITIFSAILLRTEQSLTHAVSERAKAAEQVIKNKDRFLAAICHDLRQPLNSMALWLDVIRCHDDEIYRTRAVNALDITTKIQKRLIEDLLDIAAINEGKIKLETSKLDLDHELAFACETMRGDARIRNITILPPSPSGFLLFGDHSRIQQIFWNLISNAIKYSPEGSEIWFSVCSSDQDIEISVHDSGEGIASEELDLIFEPWWQRGVKERRGLGLGLMITKWLTELQGGKISVCSPGIGKGSTFKVTFSKH